MKKSIFMLAAAAVMASCTKNEIYQSVAEPTPIQLYSTSNGIVGEANTRKPYVDAISADNPLKALVLSATTSATYTTALHTRGEMTFVGGSAPSSYDVLTLSDANKAFFPGPATASLYLAGLYPTTLGWTVSAPATATVTFNGHEDVMVAAEVNTTQNQVKENNIRTLAFKHVLTKLEIGVKAVTNAAAGKWGRITKIELVSVNGITPHKKVDVNLTTAVASPATSPAQSTQNLYAMSKDATNVATYTDNVFVNGQPGNYVTLTEAGATVAYAMIAPFSATATATDLRFNVYTEVNGVTPAVVNVPLSAAGPTAGNAYGITFTFSADETYIQALATVIPWVEGGNIEAPVTK